MSVQWVSFDHDEVGYLKQEVKSSSLPHNDTLKRGDYLDIYNRNKTQQDNKFHKQASTTTGNNGLLIMNKSLIPSSYNSNLKPSFALKLNLCTIKHVSTLNSRRARFFLMQLAGLYEKGLNAVGSRIKLSLENTFW